MQSQSPLASHTRLEIHGINHFKLPQKYFPYLRPHLKLILFNFYFILNCILLIVAIIVNHFVFFII